MRELHSLGFRDVTQCEEALRLSGGEVKGALSLLQRPLLEPFHQRIWTTQLEPPIDPKNPDKQVGVRQITDANGFNIHILYVCRQIPSCRGCGVQRTFFNPLSSSPQRMCRRLLALYDLPSWGRCELVLALLQEPDVTYSLEDVVQAVKESQDKDFIRRLLKNECPCCLCIFPRGKVSQ